MADGNGRPSTDKMSVDAQMEAQHGAVVVGLWLHADGTIRWRFPHTGDPQADEILMRGWLDKLRNVVLTQKPQRSPLAL